MKILDKVLEIFSSKPRVQDSPIKQRKPKKNRVEILEDHAVIYIPRRGQADENCFVDRSDLHLVEGTYWYWVSGYAHTTINKKTISMARYLLGEAPRGMRIRYKNGCRLDNRRENIEYSKDWGQVRKKVQQNPQGFSH